MSKAKRKLIRESTLRRLSELTDLGVPLATALTKLEIDACRPVVDKLLRNYKVATATPDYLVSHQTVLDSLLPDWLDEDGPVVQEQPEGWAYNGYFPHGEWVNVKLLKVVE